MALPLDLSRPISELLLPDDVILASRQLLGGIDLAPHASTSANVLLNAKRHYTPEDETALDVKWTGRVLLTPPSRQPRHSQYVTKLIKHHTNGDVPQAVIVSNIPELMRLMPEILDFPFCIPYRRLRYRWLDPNNELRVISPSSWNVIFYLPPCGSIGALADATCRFAETFSSVGRCIADSGVSIDWRRAYERCTLRASRNLLETAVALTQRR